MARNLRAFLYTFPRQIIHGRVSVAVCLSRFFRPFRCMHTVWHGLAWTSVSVATVWQIGSQFHNWHTGWLWWPMVPLLWRSQPQRHNGSQFFCYSHRRNCRDCYPPGLHVLTGSCYGLRRHYGCFHPLYGAELRCINTPLHSFAPTVSVGSSNLSQQKRKQSAW
jgi:hypothetical protein